MALQASFKKMLQRSGITTIAKFKYQVLVPLMLVALVNVSCSVDDPEIIEEDTSVSEEIENSGYQIYLKHRIEMREKIQKIMNGEVPITGCEDLLSNEERKECLFKKVRENIGPLTLVKGELKGTVKESNSQI